MAEQQAAPITLPPVFQFRVSPPLRRTPIMHMRAVGHDQPAPAGAYALDNAVPSQATTAELAEDRAPTPEGEQEFLRNQRQYQRLTAEGAPKQRRELVDFTRKLYENQIAVRGSTASADEQFCLPAVWKHMRYRVTVPSDDRTDRLFQDHLYLFNVIVALEWQPSRRYLRRFEIACRRASDFLYDVTDGYMALGQVIVGGPELLGCADIQISASNRLNARSWVGGLHLDQKYMPIRMGRAVWHKHNRVSISWEEPEGYRMLVHEWGHYALNLRDEYLETVGVPLSAHPDLTPPDLGSYYTLVLPRLSLARETIMSSLEGVSELVPSRRGGLMHSGSPEWYILADWFPEVDPRHPPLDGPTELPLRLPRVLDVTDQPAAGRPDDDPILVDFPAGMSLDHCWVYLIEGRWDEPRRIIAQGSLDARAGIDGFTLLGAEAGHTAVLVGEDTSRNALVQWSTIERIVPEEVDTLRRRILRCRVRGWRDATPAFPFVDMIPGRIAPDALTSSDQGEHTDERIAELALRIGWPGDALPGPEYAPTAWLAPLGYPCRQVHLDAAGPLWRSEPIRVECLDGHVLVQCSESTFTICTFSQGGGPGSNTPSGPPPISGGSSDGNLMIFFSDEEPGRDYSTTRVVTTRLQGVAGAPDGAEPRSYVFSLCSNEPLPEQLHPTLILHYDNAGQPPGVLRIHRWEDGGWRPIPTFEQPGRSYAAAPLTSKKARTAPNLVEYRATERVERYRLFWYPLI